MIVHLQGKQERSFFKINSDTGITYQGIFTDSQDPVQRMWHVHLPVMPTRGEGLSSPCRKALHALGLSGRALMVISK